MGQAENGKDVEFFRSDGIISKLDYMTLGWGGATGDGFPIAWQALVAPSATNGPWQIFAMPLKASERDPFWHDASTSRIAPSAANHITRN